MEIVIEESVNVLKSGQSEMAETSSVDADEQLDETVSGGEVEEPEWCVEGSSEQSRF